MPASRTTNATDPGPLQLYVERVDAVSEWNPLRTSESRPITRSGGLLTSCFSALLHSLLATQPRQTIPGKETRARCKQSWLPG